MRHMRHSPVRNVMKTTVKRGKKKSLNVVIAVLLGLLSPPCFPLPTAQTTSQCCQQCRGIAFAAQGSGRNAGFFPLKAGFSLSEETAPQPQGLKESWFLHTSSTTNNGLTTSGNSSKRTVPVANPSSNKP